MINGKMKDVIVSSEAIWICSDGFCQIVTRDENPQKPENQVSRKLFSTGICGNKANRFEKVPYKIRIKASLGFIAVDQVV